MNRLFFTAALASLLAACHDRISEPPGPGAPAAPVLDAVSSPTNLASATIAGAAPPGSTVTATGGLAAAQATADPAGRFSVTVGLNTAVGQETVNDLAVTYTLSGAVSEAAFALIVHDPVAPFPPFASQYASPTSAGSVTVGGLAEAYSLVSVSGGLSAAAARAASDGSFTVQVPLVHNARNTLYFTATDGAGNSSLPSQIDVVHDDTPPPAAVPSLLRAWHDGSRLVVEGNWNCVEPLAVVEAQDITTLNPVERAASSVFGDFTAVIPDGANGNTVEVKVYDHATNLSLAPHSTVVASLSWTVPAAAGSPPPARTFAACDFDYANDRVFLFGGLDSGGASQAGTFLKVTPGSEAWTPLSASSPPGPRYGHTVNFDGSSKMLVFGGRDPAGTTPWLQDLFELDVLSPGAETWTALSGGGPPPERAFHAAAYDVTGGRLIVFGGENAGGTLSDLWQCVPSNPPAWSQVAAAGSPPPALAGACAVFDPASSSFLLFGGRDSAGQLSNQVWVLDLSAAPVWSAMTPAGTAPAARDGASAFLDRISSRMFVFGGNTGTARTNDLHVLDVAGALWTTPSPGGAAPAARDGACAAFDLRRLRAAVFGGGSNGVSGTLLGDFYTLE